MNNTNMFQFVLAIFLFIFSLPNVSASDMEDALSKMYNIASSGTSEFDGAKHIRMSNMVCFYSSIMFELYQDTDKSKKGIALLKAGTKSITNIGEGESLDIKLDGKLYSFKSADVVTEHEKFNFSYGVTVPFSNKKYIVPESFVRNVASSKVFLARIHILNSSFVEGKCSPITLKDAEEQTKKYGGDLTQEMVDISNKYTPLNGFREFVKMMDATEW